MAAANPTGPRPVISRLSAPLTPMRFSASNAVPNPHAQNAPSMNDRLSGSLMQAFSSVTMNGACPPSRCHPCALRNSVLWQEIR